MSPPVAIARSTGPVSSWRAGKPNTATRAPRANDRADRLVSTHAASASSPAAGASTNPAPANVITALPPRREAKAGKAWPSIAAAAAA